MLESLVHRRLDFFLEGFLNVSRPLLEILDHPPALGLGELGLLHQIVGGFHDGVARETCESETRQNCFADHLFHNAYALSTAGTWAGCYFLYCSSELTPDVT